MLDVLDKYDSLLSYVRKSKEYDKGFYQDLLEFLYRREQDLEEEDSDEEALIEWWNINNSDD